MSDTPKTLTDEVMGLVDHYSLALVGIATMPAPTQARIDASVMVAEGIHANIRTRLQEIETELNYLRKLHAADLAWDKLLGSPKSIAYLDKMADEICPPRVEQHQTLVTTQLSTENGLIVKPLERTSALPCSNTGYDEEEGG